MLYTDYMENLRYKPYMLIICCALLLLALAGCVASAPDATPDAAESTARILLLNCSTDQLLADTATHLAAKYDEQLAQLPLDGADIASLAETYPELAAVIILAAEDSAAVAGELRQTLGEDVLLIAALPGEEQAEAACAAADVALDINYGWAQLNQALRQAVGLKVPALVCFTDDEQAATELEMIAGSLDLTLELAGLPADYAEALTPYIEQYGEDCAFLTTDESGEAALLSACIEAHVKLPLHLSLSPFVWSEVSGIELPQQLYSGTADYLAQVRNWLMNEKFISNHYASWRYPAESVVVAGAVSFALDWVNGRSESKTDPIQLRQSLLNAGASQIDQPRDNLWLMLPNTYVFGSNTNMDCDC